MERRNWKNRRVKVRQQINIKPQAFFTSHFSLTSSQHRHVNAATSIRLASVSTTHHPSQPANSSHRMESVTSAGGLPPDLFDATTLQSLASVLVIVSIAYGTSLKALSPTTPGSLRFLFIWHMFDALIHFALEGSFLYHCFFSWLPVSDLTVKQLAKFHPTPEHFLGTSGRIYGAQAGDGFWANLWMVYAKADKRWAGADLVCARQLNGSQIDRY